MEIDSNKVWQDTRSTLIANIACSIAKSTPQDAETTKASYWKATMILTPHRGTEAVPA